MKRLFILLVILAMAFVAMPVFATESIGPPGVIAGLYTCPVDTFVLSVSAEKVIVEPMLAGLMYGARLNGWMDNAAEAYLIPVADTSPSLGSVD